MYINKIERRFVEYSHKLPPLTESQKRYAEKHLPKMYVKYRNKYYCYENGDMVNSTTEIPEEADYPWTVYNRCGTIDYKYTIVTTYNGIQCLRTILVRKKSKPNSNPTYEYYDIYHTWITEDGKKYVVAKAFMPLKNGCFNLQADLRLRKINRMNECDYKRQYIVYISKIAGYAKKKGINPDNCRNKSLTCEDLFYNVINDNISESLLKIDMLNNTTLNNKQYYRQFVIAHRHNYKPNDFGMWVDYIKMLEECNKDIHNPNILCPADLKNEHDKLNEKIIKFREKERRLRELKELTKNSKDYDKFIKRFKDIVISNNNIIIKPLMKVKDFYDEGMAMKHCVFTNKYYKNRNSIILSARDNNNNRIETIEYDIVNNTVIQSRGVCNQSTPFHNTILSMMSRLRINKNKTYTIL